MNKKETQSGQPEKESKLNFEARRVVDSFMFEFTNNVLVMISNNTISNENRVDSLNRNGFVRFRSLARSAKLDLEKFFEITGIDFRKSSDNKVSEENYQNWINFMGKEIKTTLSEGSRKSPSSIKTIYEDESLPPMQKLIKTYRTLKPFEEKNAYPTPEGISFIYKKYSKAISFTIIERVIPLIKDEQENKTNKQGKNFKIGGRLDANTVKNILNGVSGARKNDKPIIDILRLFNITTGDYKWMEKLYEVNGNNQLIEKETGKIIG